MEPLPKIVVTLEADQALDQMLTIVNQDSSSGRVKKAQFATWIILHFHAKAFSKLVTKIRADHFDEIAHLRSVITKLEEARRSNQELKLGELLSPLKTKAKKPTTRTKVKPDED